MARNVRSSLICAVIVGLIGNTSLSTLLASEPERATDAVVVRTITPPAGFVMSDTTRNLIQNAALTQTSAAAQWGRRYGRRGGNGGAAAAIAVGAVAAIVGGAVLAYANRPECSAMPAADGCGYGTKVVGGAVLTGGLVGLTIGAALWR